MNTPIKLVVPQQKKSRRSHFEQTARLHHGQDIVNNRFLQAIRQTAPELFQQWIDYLDELAPTVKSNRERLGQQLASKFGDEQAMLYLGEAYLRPSIDFLVPTIDPQVANTLPLDLCRRIGCVPISIVKRNVMVGSCRLLSTEFEREVRDVLQQKLGTGIRLVFVLILSSRLHEIWAALETASAVIAENRAGGASLTFDRDDLSVHSIDSSELMQTNTPGATTNVDTIFMLAANNDATDIHFEPGSNGLFVRCRIDGMLRPISTVQPTGANMETRFGNDVASQITTRIKVLAKMDNTDMTRPQDGSFRISLNSRHSDARLYDVRVSSVPCMFGEKIVCRLLRKDSSRIPSLSCLGYTSDDIKLVMDYLDIPNGMILVTGPTGSGKTTTIHSLLGTIRTRDISLTTIEDPVEYTLPGATQITIQEAKGLTFANILRHILRQDPDVIMVGEIRDPETASVALSASLTGHLVFSTLHTNDCVQTAMRLLDMGVEPFKVSAGVRLIIAQRLVRRICPACLITERWPVNIQEIYPNIDFRTQPKTGKGCTHCGMTGYKGRTAIAEFFEITDPVRAVLCSHGNVQTLYELQKGQGHNRLFGKCLDLVAAGQTDIKEAFRMRVV